MQFKGADAALERAIEADDPRGVEQALAAGANVDARGALNVTPLAYAVGTFRRQAAEALVRARANPNLADDGGESAVSLAVNAYARDPSLLRLVLDAGGDPNMAGPNGDPVIARFLNDANLDGIGFLHARGANIDAKVADRPMIVSYAISADWDVVWRLVELGARLDDPRVREGLVFAFKVPAATPPDSPLYPAKVKVWQRLKQLGLDPIPPMGM